MPTCNNFIFTELNQLRCRMKEGHDSELDSVLEVIGVAKKSSSLFCSSYLHSTITKLVILY